MAPEQAKGAKLVGPRTDIYALGVILFEMVTGRPPFQGDELAELLAKQLFELPPSPRTLVTCSTEMEFDHPPGALRRRSDAAAAVDADALRDRLKLRIGTASTPTRRRCRSRPAHHAHGGAGERAGSVAGARGGPSLHADVHAVDHRQRGFGGDRASGGVAQAEPNAQPDPRRRRRPGDRRRRGAGGAAATPTPLRRSPPARLWSPPRLRRSLPARLRRRLHPSLRRRLRRWPRPRRSRARRRPRPASRRSRKKWWFAASRWEPSSPSTDGRWVPRPRC